MSVFVSSSYEYASDTIPLYDEDTKFDFSVDILAKSIILDVEPIELLREVMLNGYANALKRVEELSNANPWNGGTQAELTFGQDIPNASEMLFSVIKAVALSKFGHSLDLPPQAYNDPNNPPVIPYHAEFFTPEEVDRDLYYLKIHLYTNKNWNENINLYTYLDSEWFLTMTGVNAPVFSDVTNTTSGTNKNALITLTRNASAGEPIIYLADTVDTWQGGEHAYWQGGEPKTLIAGDQLFWFGGEPKYHIAGEHAFYLGGEPVLDVEGNPTGQYHSYGDLQYWLDGTPRLRVGGEPWILADGTQATWNYGDPKLFFDGNPQIASGGEPFILPDGTQDTWNYGDLRYWNDGTPYLRLAGEPKLDIDGNPVTFGIGTPVLDSSGNPTYYTEPTLLVTQANFPHLSGYPVTVWGFVQSTLSIESGNTMIRHYGSYYSNNVSNVLPLTSSFSRTLPYFCVNGAGSGYASLSESSNEFLEAARNITDKFSPIGVQRQLNSEGLFAHTLAFGMLMESASISSTDPDSEFKVSYIRDWINQATTGLQELNTTTSQAMATYIADYQQYLQDAEEGIASGGLYWSYSPVPGFVPELLRTFGSTWPIPQEPTPPTPLGKRILKFTSHRFDVFFYFGWKQEVLNISGSGGEVGRIDIILEDYDYQLSSTVLDYYYPVVDTSLVNTPIRDPDGDRTLLIREWTSTTSYNETRIYGFKYVDAFTRPLTAFTRAFNDKILFPLDMALFENIPFNDRERIASSTFHVLILDREKVETIASWIGFVVQIIAIAITIVSVGGSSSFASLAWQLVKSKLVQYVLQEASRIIGGDSVFLQAVLVVAVSYYSGGFKGFDSLESVLKTVLATLSNFNVVKSAEYEQKLAEIEEQLEENEKDNEELVYYKELYETTIGNSKQLLTIYTILFETESAFFSRTIERDTTKELVEVDNLQLPADITQAVF